MIRIDSEISFHITNFAKSEQGGDVAIATM